MIVEAIVFSIAAVVLGGTYMGLKFAAEFDPELKKIREEKSRAKEQLQNLPESKKARKAVEQAIDEAARFPTLSRKTVETQVKLFPDAFSDEERKRLIKWANEW